LLSTFVLCTFDNNLSVAASKQLQATLTDRQCDHQPTEKKPAAHFSTFGFARHTSQPFAKPKELKFPHRTQTVDKMFSI
jgi:hypothetical protein